MQIQDSAVTRLIERIGEHYCSNITNRFIRPSLLQLNFDNQSWDLMEDLTVKPPGQIIYLEEMYRQIGAAARFVAILRRDLPDVRGRVLRSAPSSSDKVLREMAANNLGSNLQVFADLVNELYVKLVDLDKASSKGRTPVYSQTPELENVGRFLVG